MAFVMVPSEVKSLAHRGEKEGRVSYWLQLGQYDQAAYRERWDRIGTPHEALQVDPTTTSRKRKRSS